MEHKLKIPYSLRRKLVKKLREIKNDLSITLYTQKFDEATPIYNTIQWDNLIEVDPGISPSEEIKLLKHLKKEKYDVCINDQLNTDVKTAEYLTKVSTKSITFDDLGNGNILFDHILNILYPSDKKIEQEMNSYEYLILDDYTDIKREVHFSPEVKTIFINQGAADTWGSIPDIITDLNYIKGDIKLKILLGPSFKHYKELGIALEQNMKEIEVHNFTDNVAALATDCDLAILGAGNTLFEVLSIGIPVIVSTREKKELITTRRLWEEDLIYSENKSYSNRLHVLVNYVINDVNGRKKKFEMNRKMFTYNGLDNIAKLIIREKK